MSWSERTRRGQESLDQAGERFNAAQLSEAAAAAVLVGILTLRSGQRRAARCFRREAAVDAMTTPAQTG